MYVVEIISDPDGRFVFVSVAAKGEEHIPYKIRMTPRCLYELGWTIGTKIGGA